MNFDTNWERWCKISIIKHFDDGKGDTKCFVEGFTRATQNDDDFFEVRIDGPELTQPTKGKWKLTFVVDILVVVKTGQDRYRINRLTGRITELFLDCIEVRRWGDGSEDDQTVLGCLKLVPHSGNEPVRVTHFGKVKPDTEILQASVEGTFEIKID